MLASLHPWPTSNLSAHRPRVQPTKSLKNWHTLLINFMRPSLPSLKSATRQLSSGSLPAKIHLFITIQLGRRLGCVPLPCTIWSRCNLRLQQTSQVSKSGSITKQDKGHVVRDLSALLQFLSSCPVLRTFTMHLLSPNSTVETSLPVENRIELASVDTLDFHFESCEGPLIKAFFNAARFSNASTMKLFISTFKNRVAGPGCPACNAPRILVSVFKTTGS